MTPHHPDEAPDYPLDPDDTFDAGALVVLTANLDLPYLGRPCTIVELPDVIDPTRLPPSRVPKR